MKLTNDIQKIKNIAQERSKLSSSLLILTILISYFAYDFMNNNYESSVENPLSTKSFNTLADLKKTGIDFTKIDAVFERIFNYTTDINAKITPSGYEGRYNPFSI